MRILFEAAVSNALVAGILALVVAVICRFPLRPAVRHALWLIVLVKFITPPLMRIEWPTNQAWLNAWAATTVDEESQRGMGPFDLSTSPEFDQLPSQRALVLSELRMVEGGFPAVELPTHRAAGAATIGPEGSPDAKDDAQSPTGPAPQQSIAEAARGDAEPVSAMGVWIPVLDADTGIALLGIVWVGGSVGWFLFAGFRLRLFHRQIDRLRQADAALQTLAEEVAAGLGLVRRPELRMTEAIVPPMLTLRPNRAMIILPTRLMESLSRAQQSAILAHELAHFRRGDQWMRWFEFLVVGLYWWHPAVWYARKELQAAEELCCDAWVVRVFPDQAKGYAHALLTAVDFLAEVRTPAPAEACALGPLSSLKQRLDMILKRKPFPELSPAARLALVALAFIILPWAPEMFGQDAPPAPTAENKPASSESLPSVTPAAPPAAGNPQAAPPSLVIQPAGTLPPAAPAAGATVPLTVTGAPRTESTPPSALPVPAPPVAPNAPAAAPSVRLRTVTWPVTATYAEAGTPGKPGAAGQGPGSVEERLDRLERMLEQFLLRTPAAVPAGVGGAVPGVVVTVPNPPVAATVPASKRANWTEDVLAVTDRRIQELEQELTTLKRRKEALAQVDPNGIAVFVVPNDKTIRAINVTTGAALWTFSIDNPESVQSTRSDGKVVTVSTKDGNTFRLDSKTGRLILEAPTSPRAHEAPKPPVPSEDGRQKF